jgi:hypothetical protein
MNDLDQIRANALAKIDRAAMWFRLALWGALLFEGLFTVGIIYFADFRSQLHLLILCCTGVIYMPVILGLLALGAHINRCTLRILARLDDVR